jgi:hypothetical protein
MPSGVVFVTDCHSMTNGDIWGHGAAVGDNHEDTVTMFAISRYDSDGNDHKILYDSWSNDSTLLTIQISEKGTSPKWIKWTGATLGDYCVSGESYPVWVDPDYHIDSSPAGNVNWTGVEVIDGDDVKVEFTPQTHFNFDGMDDGDVLVRDGSKWTSSSTSGKKSSVRQSLGLGGSSMGNSGDILMVESTGTSMEYVPYYDSIGVYVDNGSNVLGTGDKGHRVIPYNLELVEWTVTSNITGDVGWSIGYGTSGGWPSTSTIVPAAFEVPNLSNQAYDTSTISSGWTKKVFDAGDVIKFNLDSVSGCNASSLTFKTRRLP